MYLLLAFLFLGLFYTSYFSLNMTTRSYRLRVYKNHFFFVSSKGRGCFLLIDLILTFDSSAIAVYIEHAGFMLLQTG